MQGELQLLLASIAHQACPCMMQHTQSMSAHLVLSITLHITRLPGAATSQQGAWHVISAGGSTSAHCVIPLQPLLLGGGVWSPRQVVAVVQGQHEEGVHGAAHLRVQLLQAAIGACQPVQTCS